MIHVDFPEPDSDEWRNWCQKAAAARIALIDKVVNRKEQIRINDDLYKEMRETIFNAFHGKCAYCEAEFKLDQTGQVEHFRPKKGVHDEDDKPVTIQGPADPKPRPHPGYYWLAYDWHNLLPACEKCNQTPKKRENIGKGNRFPVAGRAWAVDPDGERNEHPLLIHPVLQEPADHLFLDTATGVIGYKTPEGEMTIRVLGLNREGLPEARRRAYAEVLGCLSKLIQAVPFAAVGFPQAVKDVSESLMRLNSFKRGEAEYSWAGRLAIQERVRPTVPIFMQLNDIVSP